MVSSPLRPSDAALSPIKPLHRKPLRRKPRYAKPSRTAAIAKPRSGGVPDGEVPPEGFSIDTAAISTAIFITAAAPMKRSSSPSRLGAVPETKRGIIHTFLTRYRSGGTPLRPASARDQEALRAVALRDWGQPQP
ncbi:hypothetical protein QYE76_040299 [Lolium multiflorum]|uniref:Uncharacterized protein n=1 Tax=Lolium multiflorum TaxID=4521 RepID=A0AAD8TD44_LOLMU|nr:hypothetical protein QYE76_040299 [Lolium multiflorum]